MEYSCPSSSNLKTNFAFWHSLNVMITERYVPAEVFRSQFVVFGETKMLEKIDNQ